MGISPQTSAIQSTGETWDIRNLYVADSSVFPTALGVNPMITISRLHFLPVETLLNHLKINNSTDLL
jgi:choline dehydrogenase-like flavoprotein